MLKAVVRGLLAALLATASVAEARPPVTLAMKPFVSEGAAVIALVHARVIDGTGRPPRKAMTVLLKDGIIAAVGPDGSVAIPPEARVIDLTGKSVLPGLVQLHEHLWMYGGSLLSVPVSYPRLYLAAGVTSIRTAGSYNPYVDLKARKDIEEGREVGPWMDLSVYLDLFGAPRLFDAEATRRYLTFWLDSGFTSVKAYGKTNPVALKAAIDLAHARGVKITGHLCSVTYAQAAEMGIDDIEHGFAMAPDFLPEAPPVAMTPDEEAEGAECGAKALGALNEVDPAGPRAKALIATLVRHKVAITSTLPALESITAAPPEQPGVELMPQVLQDYHRSYARRMRDGSDPAGLLLPDTAVRKSAQIERAFMKAGGLLVSGTDPAVPSGGLIAGYSSHRQLELMVAHGFTPLEAIRVATLNGAIYLGRDRLIGSIEAGKQADLLIVSGDPSARISDVAKVQLVFRQGVGYDPAKLRESVTGLVGLK